MSVADLTSRLRNRYPEREYVFLSEVRNSTGYAKQVRTADVMAMSLWPSRGIGLIGFEIKVSRADFLREMKQPEKAEEMARHCSEWWIVAGDESVAKPEDLPVPWGLLLPKGDKGLLVAKKAAHVNGPDAYPKEFVASLLRGAAVIGDGVVKNLVAQETKALNKLVDAHVEEAAARESNAYQRGRASMSSVVEQFARHRELVADFEKRTGMSIGRDMMTADVKWLQRTAKELLEASTRITEAVSILTKEPS